MSFYIVIRVFTILFETATDETFTSTQTQRRIPIKKFMICNRGFTFTDHFLFYLIIGNILNKQFKYWKNTMYLPYINFISFDTIQNIKLKKIEVQF